MDSEGMGLTAVVSYALPFEEIVARWAAGGRVRSVRRYIT